MKPITKHIITLLFLVCSLVSHSQELDFRQCKSRADKASLTSSAYFVDYIIDTANFSPELRLPVQIFYDSSAKNPGILGAGWKIPQLESSAIPNESGAEWTTPWGEKILFYSRKNTSSEVLSLYNENERENAYFSPFADWTANGRADSGSWTIFGRKEMRGWKFVYIDAKLREITAPSGQKLNFEYSKGLPVAIKQKGVEFISLKYDKKGLASEVIINGIVYKFAFTDENLRILPNTQVGEEQSIATFFLSKVYQEGLNPLEFQYSTIGYLTKISQGDYIDDISVDHETVEQRKQFLATGLRNTIDGRILADSKFKYEYPANNSSHVRLLDKLGQVAEYNYDALRGIMKSKDFSGKESTIYYFMRYDVAYNGKIRQVLDGQNRVVASYRYDKDSGKITRFRDAAKNDVNYKYDAKNNLILITKRGADEANEKPVKSFVYTGNGLKPSKINLLNESGEVVQTTNINYDSELRPIAINDGRNSLRIAYNFYGYPIKYVNSFNNETVISYDRYNRVLSEKTPRGVLKCKEYNIHGKLHKIYSEFNGSICTSTEFTYDKNNNLVARKFQNGLVQRYDRNEQGKISTEIAPDESKVEYFYDELGRIVRVIDQNNNEIKFAWNQYGLDSRITAIGQITQNIYDQFGHLSATESKFEGQAADKKFTYAYNELGKLSNVVYGENEIESIKYDSWGRVIEHTKNNSVATFKYDHFGRILEKHEGDTVSTYTYDNYGSRLSRITTTKNGVLDEYNTYDKYGRLVKRASNGETIEYIYGSKEKDLLVEQVIGETRILFTYTDIGQLHSKTMIKNDGTVLSELKYFYDASGAITSRLANGKLQSYKYDSKGQLLAVVDMESSAAVEEYVYDPAGNILKKTINGIATRYTYDATNQLVSSVSEDGVEIRYTHDAAGRLIGEGDKTYNYGWNDKVLSVMKNSNALAFFEYHNNGQLAKTIKNGHVENLEWDGLALIERGDTKYINDPHRSGGAPVLSINAVNNARNVILNDMLGTSIGKAKDDGYSPIELSSFGKLQGEKNAFFTGKPYIEELGYTFMFRNYRADNGKWLTIDPLGYPDGWNNLAYLNNNSIRYFDKYGLAPGDIYPTPDAAATQWGKDYNGQSISESREYGSTIYKNGNGYSYTEPNKGGNDGVTPSPAPDGSKGDAYVHSHGSYEDGYNNDNFSGADENYANNNKIDGYVTTPDGRLQKYDHNTGDTTEVSNNMPYDPNHPNPANPNPPPNPDPNPNPGGGNSNPE